MTPPSRPARRRPLVLSAFLAWSAAAALLPGCDLVLGPSKVASGARYSSGDARYDGFFDAVHQQQLAAGSWRDDKATARKAIVSLAGVASSSASDEVLVRAVRERAKALGAPGGRLEIAPARVVLAPGAKDDPPLVAAVAETARRELERARKMVAVDGKLEQLGKQGEALEREAADEISNSPDKVDEKKTAKRREVRRELGGAVSALAELRRSARRHVKEAEELLDGLDSALQHKEHVAHGDRVFPPAGGGEEARADRADKSDKSDKADAKDGRDAAPRPKAATKPAGPSPVAKPAETKKPAPAAKPADAPAPPEGEVFNP
jgi:hypothetical protein